MPLILAVDKEPAIRSLIAVALRQNGFSVRTTGRGTNAIAFSQSHRGEILLVITDVTLPDMDGLTLVRRILALDPGIPVLFTSAEQNSDELKQCVYSDVLGKPFSIEALLAKVRALVRGRALASGSFSEPVSS